MIRNLAGQYDAEGEEARFEKKIKTTTPASALRALFASEIMQGSRQVPINAVLKIFLPVQLVDVRRLRIDGRRAGRTEERPDG